MRHVPKRARDREGGAVPPQGDARRSGDTIEAACTLSRWCKWWLYSWWDYLRKIRAWSGEMGIVGDFERGGIVSTPEDGEVNWDGMVWGGVG